jgi:hypothetical protein
MAPHRVESIQPGSASSFSCGPAPLYGTCCIFTPACLLKISPVRCCGVPLPAEAKLKAVGCALIAARNSSIVRAGKAGFTSSTSGKAEIWITGARSLIGLYGSDL